MPQAPKVLNLPEGVRQELDARLRANGYSGFVSISQWLAREHGQNIGKTTLANYGRALLKVDVNTALRPGLLRDQLAASTKSDRTLNELLIELGRIRVREHEILTQIQALKVGAE